MFHHLCPLILPPAPWGRRIQAPSSSSSGRDFLYHFLLPPEETSPFTLTRGCCGQSAVWDSSSWGKEWYISLNFPSYYYCYKWYKNISAVAVWKLKRKLEAGLLFSRGNICRLNWSCSGAGDTWTDWIHIWGVDLAKSLFNKTLLSTCSEQAQKRHKDGEDMVSEFKMLIKQ